MNKIIKIGLGLIGAALVLFVIGIILSVTQTDDFTGMAYLFLLMSATAPILMAGIATVIAGVIRGRLKKSSPTPTRTSASISHADQRDLTAKKLYIIAGSLLLVKVVMMIPFLADANYNNTNNWLLLFIINPLDLVTSLAPIASIFLGLIGAFGAKSNKMKLTGIGLIALAFLAYLL